MRTFCYKCFLMYDVSCYRYYYFDVKLFAPNAVGFKKNPALCNIAKQ